MKRVGKAGQRAKRAMKKVLGRFKGGIKEQRASDQFSCPICKYYGAFRTHRFSGRRNVVCPKCGNLERHRLVQLYFKTLNDGDFAGKVVLHVAPEACFRSLLTAADKYIACDRVMGEIECAVDVSDLPFKDETFDWVICNHVLEHVEEDRKALVEFFRVLRPLGRAILTVPIIYGWEKTYENDNIRLPDDRRRHFNQEDHVRLYGSDFPNRIGAAGFEVERFQASPEDCARYRLVKGDTVFIGRKR